MSIDEAIDYADEINRTVTFPADCKEDEEFFSNVVDWLKELKAYREKDR